MRATGTELSDWTAGKVMQIIETAFSVICIDIFYE